MEREPNAPVLVLVHTVPPLVDEFGRLVTELLPEVRALHVLDEPLLDHIRTHGPGTDDIERIASHVAAAEAVGARAVLVTCSTVSLSVDEVRPRFGTPIVKIDEAMAHEAVTTGRRVAILATNPTTLGPSRTLLAGEAAAAGRDVELSVHLVAHALDALLAGDGARHDELVSRAIDEVARDVDVVVLAQASTARVMRSIPPSTIPILASPYLALEQVRRILQAPAFSRSGTAQREVGP